MKRSDVKNRRDYGDSLGKLVSIETLTRNPMTLVVGGSEESKIIKTPRDFKMRQHIYNLSERILKIYFVIGMYGIQLLKSCKFF